MALLTPRRCALSRKRALCGPRTAAAYVTPQTDTTYTLTIEDAEGHTKTATVWVQVR